MAELTGSSASMADFIWKNAEDLWGDFKHIDFGKIILPFTLLRRLECVLELTRQEVLVAYDTHKETGIDLDLILRQVTHYPFYNTSEYALGTLGGTKTRQNLQDYIAHFSDNARIIFEQFDFSNTIIRLDKAHLLYKICKNFAAIDLHPHAVPDRVMSNIYEHLIRRFGAEINEGAEDFMTPRDVVHLATALLLDPDDELFEGNPGLIRTLYDPACGTGGFLTDAMNHVADYGSRFKAPPVLIPYGQELEPETHAVCLTAMLLRTLESDPGRDLSKNIKLGSTLSNDQFPNDRFHYCISNPPFGKNGKKIPPSSMPNIKRKATTVVLALACRASMTDQCCSYFNLPASLNSQRKAEVGRPLSFPARLYSTVAPVRVNPRFAAGCWSKTWLKLSSPCQQRSFSAPASQLISGYYQTGNQSTGRIRFS